MKTEMQREYEQLCRIDENPGVQGLAQLGRNAINRVSRLESQLARADARIAELDRECGALREFALEIMECWPHGDVDGCDLEIAAFKHGLIAMKDPKPTEPCGECCACSGYPTPEEWAEGINCYVRTPLLTGKTDAARANGGEG